MAFRRRVAVGRVMAPRRQTLWIGSAFTAAEGQRQLGGSSVVLDQSFTQAQIQAIGPSTIVRTIGELVVQSDQLAASENTFGALGFMVVREQARAAGIASLPTPGLENFDDGFFGHLYWYTSERFLTAAGFDGIGYSRYAFDFKSQRKITGDDAIVVTMENGAAAALGINYHLNFRMLLKLH